MFSFEKNEMSQKLYGTIAMCGEPARKSHMTLMKLLPISLPGTSRDNDISLVSSCSLLTQDAKTAC